MTEQRSNVFLYENQKRLMAMKAKEILGKESYSLFAFAASLVVLGKLGGKAPYLNEQDRWAVRRLRDVCISSCG
jgi:hypothetical protein